MDEIITFRGNKLIWKQFSKVCKEHDLKIWAVLEPVIKDFKCNTKSNTIGITSPNQPDTLTRKQIQAMIDVSIEDAKTQRY